MLNLAPHPANRHAEIGASATTDARSDDGSGAVVGDHRESRALPGAHAARQIDRRKTRPSRAPPPPERSVRHHDRHRRSSHPRATPGSGLRDHRAGCDAPRGRAPPPTRRVRGRREGTRRRRSTTRLPPDRLLRVRHLAQTSHAPFVVVTKIPLRSKRPANATACPASAIMEGCRTSRHLALATRAKRGVASSPTWQQRQIVAHLACDEPRPPDRIALAPPPPRVGLDGRRSGRPDGRPALLAHLTAGKRTLLVSGTNGKTTTTRLVAEAASRLGSVATSGAGANMDAGLISALAATPSARMAVLEVDEAHLPERSLRRQADVVILLNLSRDQLDRTSEVRMLAERWRDVASQAPAPASSPTPTTRSSSGRPRWHPTSRGSRRAGTGTRTPITAPPVTLASPSPPLRAGRDGPARAAAAPRLGVRARRRRSRERSNRPPPDHALDPGAFNLANAAMAAIGAEYLGSTVEGALAAMSGVGEVGGRFSAHRVNGRGGFA